MKVFVRAKPKSKKEFVKKIDDTHYTVAVHAPAVNNAANRAIIESLSLYFRKPKSHIVIVSGETSRNKIIDIPVTAAELASFDPQKKLF